MPCTKVKDKMAGPVLIYHNDTLITVITAWHYAAAWSIIMAGIICAVLTIALPVLYMPRNYDEQLDYRTIARYSTGQLMEITGQEPEPCLAAQCCTAVVNWVPCYSQQCDMPVYAPGFIVNHDVPICKTERDSRANGAAIAVTCIFGVWFTSAIFYWLYLFTHVARVNRAIPIINRAEVAGDLDTVAQEILELKKSE